MARYIVIRVESTKTAETLLERFAKVPAIRTVGLFAAPSTFCEGNCPSQERSVKSERWGLWFCPDCKKPKQSRMHAPRNLLQDPTLHPRFRDFYITVWEPFMNRPEEKYGLEAINRKAEQVAQATERIARSKRRARRRKAGSDG